jgi:hypothetical protein
VIRSALKSKTNRNESGIPARARAKSTVKEQGYIIVLLFYNVKEKLGCTTTLSLAAGVMSLHICKENTTGIGFSFYGINTIILVLVDYPNLITQVDQRESNAIQIIEFNATGIKKRTEHRRVDANPIDAFNPADRGGRIRQPAQPVHHRRGRRPRGSTFWQQ